MEEAISVMKIRTRIRGTEFPHQKVRIFMAGWHLSALVQVLHATKFCFKERVQSSAGKGIREPAEVNSVWNHKLEKL